MRGTTFASGFFTYKLTLHYNAIVSIILYNISRHTLVLERYRLSCRREKTESIPSSISYVHAGNFPQYFECTVMTRHAVKDVRKSCLSDEPRQSGTVLTLVSHVLKKEGKFNSLLSRLPQLPSTS